MNIRPNQSQFRPIQPQFGMALRNGTNISDPEEDGGLSYELRGCGIRLC
jgi:hypothetical protein